MEVKFHYPQKMKNAFSPYRSIFMRYIEAMDVKLHHSPVSTLDGVNEHSYELIVYFGLLLYVCQSHFDCIICML